MKAFTLLYRWRSRLLSLLPGGLITLLIFVALSEISVSVLLLYLLVIIVLGFAWDILYVTLQKLRWDHDWPVFFELIGWLLEGITAWYVVRMLPTNIPLDVTIWQILFFYLLLGGVSFVISDILLSIVFPGRRFQDTDWLV